MNKEDIIPNALYILHPKPGEELRTWCRHNILHTKQKDNGDFIFEDTYWRGNTGGSYNFEEIKDQITFAFDLNGAKKVSEDEREQYNREDTFFIPMGAYGPEYFIKKDAEKSRKIIIERLEYTIKDKESSIRFAIRDLERKKELLENIKNGATLDNVHI